LNNIQAINVLLPFHHYCHGFAAEARTSWALFRSPCQYRQPTISAILMIHY